MSRKKRKSATSRAYKAYTKQLRLAQYRRDWQDGKPDNGKGTNEAAMALRPPAG